MKILNLVLKKLARGFIFNRNPARFLDKREKYARVGHKTFQSTCFAAI
jgi:hypothetical protein